MTRQQTLTGSIKETELVNVNTTNRTDVTKIGRSTKYGNPFKLKKDGGEYTRSESVEAFREYWYADEQAELRAHARAELKGETLGCYCKPKACHGDVIVEYLRGVDE